LLHTDTKTNNNKISFNEKLINIILSMFGRGLIPTPKTLKNILMNTKVGPTLHWIIIRFCQMCGIVLSANSVQHLTDKFMGSFQFTRADIINFIVKIKCPPILDYYTGMNYLTQAKKEKILGSKSTLFKAAFQRFENVLNYDFPYVGEFYAESLLCSMKLDKNVIGDMDLASKYLCERWNRNRKKKFSRFCELPLCFPLEPLYKEYD